MGFTSNMYLRVFTCITCITLQYIFTCATGDITYRVVTIAVLTNAKGEMGKAVEAPFHTIQTFYPSYVCSRKTLIFHWV